MNLHEFVSGRGRALLGRSESGMLTISLPAPQVPGVKIVGDDVVFAGATFEDAFSEFVSFNEACALLRRRGFLDFTLAPKLDVLPGLRWFCKIGSAKDPVWAPVLGGEASNWGFTPLGAAVAALAGGPRRDKDKRKS